MKFNAILTFENGHKQNATVEFKRTMFVQNMEKDFINGWNAHNKNKITRIKIFRNTAQ